MAMAIPIDPKIITAAKQGDESAFEQLVLAWERAIYNYLYRLVGHRETAEDLTQETFLKVYQNLSRLDPERAPTAWVFKIATNTANDWFRKQARRPEDLVETEGDFEPETLGAGAAYLDIDDRITVAEVEQALHRLKPVYREALVLHYVNGYTYEELAVLLGVPVNTIKIHVHRARAALRQVLNQPS